MFHHFLFFLKKKCLTLCLFLLITSHFKEKDILCFKSQNYENFTDKQRTFTGNKEIRYLIHFIILCTRIFLYKIRFLQLLNT